MTLQIPAGLWVSGMAKNGSGALAADSCSAGGAVAKSGYLKLLEDGELSRRAEALDARLERCDLCPRACAVDRKSAKVGYCAVGSLPRIASIYLHHWEEPPISGTGGSGTIFFSGCTLRCIFCQNYPISQLGVGREMSVEDLASGMLELQSKGAHNINLVTSTHQMPAVVQRPSVGRAPGSSNPDRL